MKHILSIFLNLIFISSIAFGQKPSKEEKKTYKLAGKQLVNEDYKDAQVSFLKLVDIAPTNDIYQFEGGLSYYFADFERAKGIPLFGEALQNSKEDTIPELYYYLGRAYHIDGEFD